jgi:photosystem II stability/assembly factor-like uncharacterized protein
MSHMSKCRAGRGARIGRHRIGLWWLVALLLAAGGLTAAACGSSSATAPSPAPSASTRIAESPSPAEEVLASPTPSNLVMRFWAVGDAGHIVAGQQDDSVLVPQPSSIGGDYWGNQVLADVTFLDPELGWAVGEEGAIIHTENGGSSW